MTTTVDEMLLPAAEVEIQAAGGKLPSVSIVAYSGGLMNVPGWGPLVIDLAGLEFSAAEIGILADHDSTLKGIVGHGRARVLADVGTPWLGASLRLRVLATKSSGRRARRAVRIRRRPMLRIPAGCITMRA